MPMYEFECNACNHRFEELVSSSSKTVEECPKCHEKEVRKLISAGSFRSNGSAASPGAAAPACSPTGG